MWVVHEQIKKQSLLLRERQQIWFPTAFSLVSMPNEHQCHVAAINYIRDEHKGIHACNPHQQKQERSCIFIKRKQNVTQAQWAFKQTLIYRDSERKCRNSQYSSCELLADSLYSLSFLIP